MKTCRVRMMALVLVSGLLVVGTLFAAEPAAGRPSVGSLTWLTGTWSFERNGRVVTEHWMAPAGGLMLGTSQTVAGGRTVEFEFMRVQTEADGALSYVAKPSKQAEAAFGLVRASARELVFENLQHDFPQRISYVLKEDGTLLAAIEGTAGGKTRRIEFPYRKIATAP